MSLLRLSLATVVAGLLVLGGLDRNNLRAQPDSVRAKILKQRGFPPDHSPREALWRSAAVPGWGQYYNRQYYKLPFVYAGLAGLAFRIYRAQQRYVLFDRAHLFGLGDQMEGGNPYSQYRSQYEKVAEEVFLGGTVRLGEVRSQRDRFRRQRDLAILGVGLFYALTLLDAYVSAHLLTFDVDEELAVRVHPVSPLAATKGAQASSNQPDVSPPQPGPTSGAGVRVQVRF